MELEKNYKERIAQRKLLYEQHGKSVLQYLPGSELACKELMEMTLQFLCARYPQYFELASDFGIMLRNPETGHYELRAGVICSALGWNLGTKMGMHLHEIHEPIPDYKEKMQFSMDRYVSRPYDHYHTDLVQFLLEDAYGPTDSAGLMGSRSRPASLYATG